MNNLPRYSSSSGISPIEQFVDQALNHHGPKNLWCNEHNKVMDVYLRVFNHPRRGLQLDVATVEVYEQHRGQGHFRKLLTEVETIARKYNFAVIFFENTFEKNLQAAYERRGFEKIVNGGWDAAPCYVWKLTK